MSDDDGNDYEVEVEIIRAEDAEDWINSGTETVTGQKLHLLGPDCWCEPVPEWPYLRHSRALEDPEPTHQ